MAVEKALYEAPVGLENQMSEAADLEIEIVDPESVTIGIGGEELTIVPGEEEEEGIEFGDNLAEHIDDTQLVI